MATTSNEYTQEQQQQQGGRLSREPSYVRSGEEETGGISHGAAVGSSNDPNRLSNLVPQIHPIRGTSHIPGQDSMNNQGIYVEQVQSAQQQDYPQGEKEYHGRQDAVVVPHETYEHRAQELAHPQGLDYGQAVQTGEYTSPVQRTIGQEHYDPAHHPQQQEYQNQTQGYPQQEQQQQGYQPANGQELDSAELQPSRSYSTYKGQTGGLSNAAVLVPGTIGDREQPAVIVPDNSRQAADGLQRKSSYAPTARTANTQTGTTTAGLAGVGAGTGLATAQQQQYVQPAEPILSQQPQQQYPQQMPEQHATAVGTGYEQQPQQQFQQQQQPLQVYTEQPNGGYNGQQRESMLSNGPTTSVMPTNAVAPSVVPTSPNSPIAGGGLGAALASSGHSLTSRDKKALKSEIKNEEKFEKHLATEAKRENGEIAAQLHLAKASIKNAEKSAKHEAGYRKTYDKAIQREIKAKKYLLKIQNEYNKVAADLESATKEMEIRRNQHIADVQTRDADQKKLEDLRAAKGRNDMEREARHGDSLTKQAQAKRALSMSKRRSVFSS